MSKHVVSTCPLAARVETLEKVVVSLAGKVGDLDKFSKEWREDKARSTEVLGRILETLTDIAEKLRVLTELAPRVAKLEESMGLGSTEATIVEI